MSLQSSQTKAPVSPAPGLGNDRMVVVSPGKPMKMKMKKAELQEALQSKGIPTIGKAIDLKQWMSDSLEELTDQYIDNTHLLLFKVLLHKMLTMLQFKGKNWWNNINKLADY